MLQDFDRTQELVNISMSSAGTTAAQHRKYMQGLEAATTALTTSYQKLITNFTNSDIAIAAVNGLSSGLEFLSENMGLVYGIMGSILALYAPLLAAKASDAIATGISTLSLLINSKALKDNSEETKKNELLKEAGVKGIKARIVLKMAEIAGIKLFTGSLEEENLALEKNNVTALLNSTIWKSHPIILLVSIVLALVAAWWALNKETEAGIRLQNTLKVLMQAVGNLFSSLLDALMPLVELFMFFVNIKMNRAVVELEVIANVISIIVNLLSSLLTLIGDAFSAIKRLLKIKDDGNSIFSKIVGFASGKTRMEWLKKFTGWVKNWTESMSEWFETPEEKAERLAGEIASLQDEIYDERQTSNTLTPLIDEYDKLSAKTVKTAEDLERIKEIEKEIGDLDKSYLNADGSVDWGKVKTRKESADDVIETQITTVKELAIEGIATGVYQEDFMTGIVDYYTEKAKDLENVSSLTAANIAENYSNVLENMSETDFMNMTEEGFDNLFKSVTALHSGLEDVVDDENRLANEFKYYQEALKSVPEDAKDSFNSIFSLYASYANMLDKLAEKGAKVTQDDFISKIQKLGLTQDEYNELLTTYQKVKPGASQDDFDYWFATAVNAGTDRTTIMQKLMTTAGSQELINAIQTALLPDQQHAIEEYTKAISASDSLREKSLKAKEGALTQDDWRVLYEENPEIFESEEALSDFLAGKYDGSEARKKAKQELEDNLNALLVAAKSAEVVDESLVRSLEQQIDELEYAELYTSEIWKHAIETTKEIKKQAHLQSQLNKLQKDAQTLTGEELTENLKEQLVIYREMHNDAKEILENANYIEAVKKGWIVDGEVVATPEDLKLASSEMIDFLSEYKDAIKEQYDNNEAALEGYRNVIQQQYENEKEILEKRKTSYENYFDKVDALEEQQERERTREGLIGSIAALAGTTGTSALRKDLLSQLEEANKAEAEARKQAIRDQTLQDMEDKVSHIDDNIDKLANMEWSELEIVASNVIGDFTHYKFTMPENKEGGLVDYTGPAWVDGTKTKPEAFLSASDTALIRAMVDGLIANLSYGSSFGEIYHETSNDYNNSSSVVIENITIQAEHLDTKQDFKSAGNVLAQEFVQIIRERGLNVNVKK